MSVAKPADRSLYCGYRFPPEIIARAVWLYFRFHLSFGDVQNLLAERGVVVSHEAIRQWCMKFGATFATGLPTTRASWRQLASGRGGAEEPRQTPLAVASR
jgi:transposase-like protein